MAKLNGPLRFVLSLLFLMVVWYVWSGYLKLHLLVFGVISSLLVMLLANRMGAFRDNSDWLALLPRLPGFWLWLAREVVISNLQVARIILSPRPAMSPTLVTIRAVPPGNLGQAILGNCITLTPGSITLDVHEGALQVHCLTRANAAALVEGEMNRRVARLTRS